jgi:hypothetical protein
MPRRKAPLGDLARDLECCKALANPRMIGQGGRSEGSASEPDARQHIG